MSWAEQTSHAKVQEMRKVSASRHDFVDRENRIILEYRVKENKYRIIYDGGNRFHVVDGFNKPVRNLTVVVTASGPYIVEAMPQEPQSLFANVVNYLTGMVSVSPAYAAGLTTKNYVTDDAGAFAVVLDASAPDPAEVTIKVGDSTQHFVMKKAVWCFAAGGQ